MKRIFTLCVILYSGAAAADVTLYYDANGVCDAGNLYLASATNCNQYITGIKPDKLPTQESKVFDGYYVDNTQIFDKDGNIISTNVSTIISTSSGVARNASARFITPTTNNKTLSYICQSGCTGTAPATETVPIGTTVTLKTNCAGPNQIISSWSCGRPVTDEGTVTIYTDTQCIANCTTQTDTIDYVYNYVYVRPQGGTAGVLCNDSSVVHTCNVGDTITLGNPGKVTCDGVEYPLINWLSGTTYFEPGATMSCSNEVMGETGKIFGVLCNCNLDYCGGTVTECQELCNQSCTPASYANGEIILEP